MLALAILAGVSLLAGCGGGASSPADNSIQAGGSASLDLNDPLQRWAYDPSAVSHETSSTPPPGAATFQLLAGQTIDVGEVSAWSDGETLFVRYLVDTDPWWLSGCHLNIGSGSPTAGDFIPGQMPYHAGPFSDPAAPFTGGSWNGTEYTFEIDMEAAGLNCGGSYWIITHADVLKYVSDGAGGWTTSGQTAFAGDRDAKREKITKKWAYYFFTTIDCSKHLDMPVGTYNYSAPFTGTDNSHYGYWDVSPFSPALSPALPADPLTSPNWVGWCSGYISYGGGSVSVKLYDTTSASFPWKYLPDGATLRAWDKVNWLINEKRKDIAGGGTGSSYDGFDDIGGLGQPAWNSAIAKAAFQMAIWNLVQEYTYYGYYHGSVSNDGTTGPLREALLASANANGAGYAPQIGDWFAVLLFDANPDINGNGVAIPHFQPNIIEVDP